MSHNSVVCAYIHCRSNGMPFYVGKGKLRRARYLGDRNSWHEKVVKKYGRENILIGIVECSTEDAAFDLERGLIKRLKRMGVPLCNFTDGGEGTSNPCPETRARIRAAAKKRGISKATRDASILAKKGVPLSEEQRKKQSDSMRESWANRTITPEHRANLRAAAKKRGVSQATRDAQRVARLGVKRGPHSEETKEKIRTAHLKRWEGHVPEKRRYPPRVRPERGWKHTDETRKKLSESHKGQQGYWAGKKRSAETIEKMRLATLKNPARYWLGKKRSEDTIRKIRETKLERGSPRPAQKSIEALKTAARALAIKRRRPVICIETGNRFPSCVEAASAYGLKYHSVLSVAGGKRASVYGKTFQYLEN